jgi:transketolase
MRRRRAWHARAKMASEKPSIATRASSQGFAIDAMFDACPELLGGSADLTGSNLTLAKGTPDFTAENRSAATCVTASANTAWPPR